MSFFSGLLSEFRSIPYCKLSFIYYFIIKNVQRRRRHISLNAVYGILHCSLFYLWRNQNARIKIYNSFRLTFRRRQTEIRNRARDRGGEVKRMHDHANHKLHKTRVRYLFIFEFQIE